MGRNYESGGDAWKGKIIGIALTHEGAHETIGVAVDVVMRHGIHHGLFESGSDHSEGGFGGCGANGAEFGM